MKIRMAQTADAEALVAIYGQYIDTPITFEYQLPAVDEFATRIADILVEYPYLVAEEQGRLLGYAYAHRQMAREAYQWNAELSVYLDQNAISQGIGTKLYQALEEILKLQGVRTVYGGVTIPNEKSQRLHLGRGFKSLGVYHNTGYKCGSWHDVEWFEKQLLPYDAEPQPVRPITVVAAESISEILTRYSTGS